MEKPEAYTDAQWASLQFKYEQANNGFATFDDFAATAYLNSMMDCVMVQWCGMWLGIERDGYTHS